MPASPRRLALTITLYVLGGAVATVLVAWGCAVTRKSLSLPHSANDIAAGWPRPVPADWPAPLYMSMDWSLGATQLDVSGSSIQTKQVAILVVWQFGWPFRSMDWEWPRKFEQSNQFVQYIWSPPAAGYRAGVPFPGAGVDPMTTWQARLPLRPIPLGFTVDTLFYATILATLFLAPRCLRRTFRLRRGLCPACAYSLSGNSTGICPECGARSNASEKHTEVPPR